MKADVKLTAEDEALEWAIVEFRRSEHQFCPGGEGWLRVEHLCKEMRLGFVHPHLEEGVTLDEWVTHRVKWAREGNQWAEKLLFELAAALIDRGKPLPQSLRTFTAEYLREPHKRIRQRPGRKPSDWAFRDFTIWYGVELIAVRWGFAHTRNEASSHSSAASIVKEALEKAVSLHLTEAAINKIWAAIARG